MKKLLLVIAFAFACVPAQGQRFIKVFDNIAALVAANPNDVHTNAFVAGRVTASDGGGGFYTWNSTSTASTNANLSILKPNNFSTGRWFRFDGSAITNSFGGFSTSFDTVADMVQATITPTTQGATVNRRSTSQASGAGGGIFFYDSTSSASTNRGTIFKPAGSSGRWLRVFSGPVSADWFDAIGNGSTDDYVPLQNALTLGYHLLLPQKTYKISQALALTAQGQSITGVDPIGSALFVTTANGSGIINGLGAGNVLGQVKLRNFTIRATDLAVTYAALDLTNVNDATIDGVYITRNDNSLSNTNGWDRPLVLNTCWKSTFQNGLVNSRPGAIAVMTDGFAGGGSGANSCKLLWTQVNAPGGIGVLLTNCNNFSIIGCVFEGTTTNAIKVATAGGFDNNNEHLIMANRFELDSIGYTPIRLESGSSRNHVIANLYGSGGAANTNNIINLGTDNEILEGNFKENNLNLKQLRIQRIDTAGATQEMGIGFLKPNQDSSGDDLYIAWFNDHIDTNPTNYFAKIEGRTAGSTGFLYVFGEMQISTNLLLTNVLGHLGIGTDTPRDIVDIAAGRLSMTKDYAIVWREPNSQDSYGAINVFQGSATNAYLILQSLNNGVLTEGLRVNTNAWVEVPKRLEVGQSGETGVIQLSSTNGTYTITMQLLSTGQLVITNNGVLVDSISLNSLYAGGGTLFKSDDGTYKAVTSPPGTVATNINMNPTDGALPYRSGSTTFGDSPWWRRGTNLVENESARVTNSFTILNGRLTQNIDADSIASVYKLVSDTNAFQMRGAVDGSTTFNLQFGPTSGSEVMSYGGSTGWNFSPWASASSAAFEFNAQVSHTSGNAFVFYNLGSPWLAVEAGTRGGIVNRTVKWYQGSGSPESVVSAPVGSFYSRTDGGAGTSFYVKESGSGDTGWVSYISPATRTNYVTVALSNPNTAVTTGNTNFWVAPEACTIKTVTAHLFKASSSGSVTIELKKNGTTVLSSAVSLSSGTTNATASVSVTSVTALDRLAGEITAAGTDAYGAQLKIGYTTP